MHIKFTSLHIYLIQFNTPKIISQRSIFLPVLLSSPVKDTYRNKRIFIYMSQKRGTTKQHSSLQSVAPIMNESCCSRYDLISWPYDDKFGMLQPLRSGKLVVMLKFDRRHQSVVHSDPILLMDMYVQRIKKELLWKMIQNLHMTCRS